MRVVVIGPGAVGGTFAGLLGRAGRDVAILGRGEHLEAIRERGLRLEGRIGAHTVALPATDRAAELGPADLILFCVKTYHTLLAAESARSLMGGKTVVISLQNGVDSEEKIGAVLGPDRVLGGIAYVGSRILRPGTIWNDLGGRLVIGEADGRATDRATKIQSFFEGSGIPCKLSLGIRADMWKKFIGNCVVNVIPAITGGRVGDLVRDPVALASAREALEEGAAVGRSQGITIEEDVIAGHLEFCRRHPEFETSTQQDIRRGRQTEVEALNGTLVRVGRAADVPVPIHSLLYSLLRAREALKTA